MIITLETTRIDTHLNSFLVKLERELRMRGLSEVQLTLQFYGELPKFGEGDGLLNR